MSSDEDKFLSDTEALTRSAMRMAIWRYRCGEALTMLYKALTHDSCTFKLDPDDANRFDNWVDEIREETTKR